MLFTSPIFPNSLALQALADRYPTLEVASVEACLTFLQTAVEVDATMDIYFSRFGLSRGKFTMLMQLLQAEDQCLTPSECATRSGVTRGTITGLLDGLERDGWVRRQPHKSDRRRATIQLTQWGGQRLDELLPEHFCRTSGLMAQFTDSEKKVFTELLAKLQVNAAAMQEK